MTMPRCSATEWCAPSAGIGICSTAPRRRIDAGASVGRRRSSATSSGACSTWIARICGLTSGARAVRRRSRRRRRPTLMAAGATRRTTRTRGPRTTAGSGCRASAGTASLRSGLDSARRHALARLRARAAGRHPRPPAQVPAAVPSLGLYLTRQRRSSRTPSLLRPRPRRRAPPEALLPLSARGSRGSGR